MTDEQVDWLRKLFETEFTLLNALNDRIGSVTTAMEGIFKAENKMLEGLEQMANQLDMLEKKLTQ